MRLLAMGKASSGAAENEILRRYAVRIKPALELVELPHGYGSAAEIKRREAEALLAALSTHDFVIALDGGGQMPTSEELARLLGRWTESGKKLSFVIGGAEGLDTSIIARADAKLSLGKLTWPHMLVRPMLAEQIYRAQMINAGHPYHRAGRP
ncbi:MAG: 23S rRNA (pseudouridine(1915)-N(3))-methyltransferase RlmH [Acidocella sp. 20-63-7]|nr:MAG: 23S rRNA (pseudouridine(1915)-N(3))-methyltransferase RlmH [Acidocella sp. 20-63-7]HQT45880.1 23S rRNA (pseudouridine(1915)-N(3))-methyltransferase RlmH [Acidocella sp.]